MKRYLKILICLGTVALLCSCKKTYTLGANPFSIEVSKIESHSAWIEIIPDNNDFYYYYDVVSVKEYEKFGSDEAFIKAKDKELKEEYVDPQGFLSFRSYLLFNGYFSYASRYIEEKTEYYAYAMAYNDDNTPEGHITKVKFKSLEYIPSDITFSLSMMGSKVTVTPSNNDPYFGDYDTVESVKENYFNLDMFYKTRYNYYREYDLLPNLIVKGVNVADISDYFTMKEDMEFYAVIAGCCNGTNTEVFKFKLTYKGEGEPGIVEVLDPAL